MSECFRPETFQEIADACLAAKQVLPRGAGTKPALLTHALTPNTSASDAEVVAIDMRGHAGVVNYDPSEFLISARAGTSITELSEVLGQQGQYLPFDPVLSRQRATLGGSIASGISGPCRLLYGSLRDFMLEVQLCDSSGREIRGGGKVVKNAAGFDLPKLVVGSYGRLGIITEATLKVFPKPPGNQTIVIMAGGMRSALEITTKLLAMPLPIAALEIDAPNKIQLRLAGPLDSLGGMTDRVLAALPQRGAAQCIDHGFHELQLWSDRSEFSWCDDQQVLVRVAVVHYQCEELTRALVQLGDAYRCVLSCGATVAWISARSVDDLPTLDNCLREQKLSGVAVRGPQSLTVLGDDRWVTPASRIQTALDPGKKWLAFQ